MEFRRAVVPDAEGIHRLNEAFNGAGATSLEDIRSSLSRPGDEIIVVAEEQGQLLGFCCAQLLQSVCYAEPFGEMTELYTAPQARGRGAARGMITLVERLLFERGARSVYLLTEPDNEEARPLYERCGYGGDEVVMYTRRLPDSRNS